MKWGLSQGILGRGREALLPSFAALGPNTYLTRNDFYKMVGIAFVAHMLVFGVASLWPHEKVTNIPVRALSFKLGDQDRIAAYGAPTGSGVSTLAKIAAPVMSASASDGTRVAYTPTPAPVKAPEPKPVKPTKVAPVQHEAKPVPRYVPQENAPAIAAKPQQYVREVGQANPQPLAPLPANPTGYGAKDGAIGGQGAVNTQTEQTKREIQQRYTQQLSDWVYRHKIYPTEGENRSARVVIRMRIDHGGTVRYYAIEQSSGLAVFDAAAIDMIRRANPMPAVPDNYSNETLFEFVIPINFTPPR